jgi:AraC family transcriptional regulator of arabinose operon
VTFGGAAINSILDSLEMNFSVLYTETDKPSLSDSVEHMIQKVEKESEFSRLESLGDLYQFLIMLKKYGKVNNQPSLSANFDKVRPVVNWMEKMYSENIGLPEMAEQANMSSQYLNALFQDAFGMSPYSFLIQLRIRKAEELLVSGNKIPLKEISHITTGFNDVSHFVATFRKKEGITPKKYRDLHHK